MSRARWPLLAVVVGAVLGVALSFLPTGEAARSAAGTYSLPTGNPVVSGQTISSSWANTTLADIGTELTDSLSRSGKGAMSAALQLYAGSSSAPGLTFSGDTDTGLYRAGAGDVRLQLDNALAQKWTAGLATFPASVSVGADAGVAGNLTVSGTALISGNATVTGTINGITLTEQGAATFPTDAGVGGNLDVNGTATVGTLTVEGNAGVTGDITARSIYATSDAGVGGNLNVSGLTSVQSLTADGIGSTEAVDARPATLATPTVPQSAFIAQSGYYGFSPVINPAADSDVANTVTPKNIIKAWVYGRTTGGDSLTVTIDDGFNLDSGATVVDTDHHVIHIPMGANVADYTKTSVFVTGNMLDLPGYWTGDVYEDNSTIRLSFWTATLPAAPYDFYAGTEMHFGALVLGAQ